MATIPLGLYLWRRIYEVGIRSVMGLPGDFNLNFLDFLYDVKGLSWIGNSNELNAAYAADGYARIKRVPGCILTTHGVGELSALNGIAGSASEHVPIIHVVGQTVRKMHENHMMIHHSIGTAPDHQVYNKASKLLRCAAAELWDPDAAPAEIDRVIRECFVQHLPVYIFMPLDLAFSQVPESLLDKKIDLTIPVDKDNEEKALKAILNALEQSKNPSVFVDFLVHSHGHQETRDLVDVLKFPVYASHMGKSIVDEDHPCFVGLYNGKVSLPGISDAIEASDLILALGWWPTDSNTSAFTRKLPQENRIDVMDTYVEVRGERYEGVYMGPLLTRLEAEAKKISLPTVQVPKLSASLYQNGFANGSTNGETSSKIMQSYIWKRIGDFLQPNDVVLADTGTAAFGLPDAQFPKNSKYICQTYYGSIGFSTPCALGVELALRELHSENPSRARGRTVLVTGDGSIQLSIQEVGTMISQGTRPIIIIINNRGYTIERAIHGARESYNDIVQYNYRYLLSLFSAPSAKGTDENVAKNYRSASTVAEFEAALQEEALTDPQVVQVLEVHMDKLDIPWRLAGILKNRDKQSHQYLIDEGFTNSE